MRFFFASRASVIQTGPKAWRRREEQKRRRRRKRCCAAAGRVPRRSPDAPTPGSGRRPRPPRRAEVRGFLPSTERAWPPWRPRFRIPFSNHSFFLFAFSCCGCAANGASGAPESKEPSALEAPVVSSVEETSVSRPFPVGSTALVFYFSPRFFISTASSLNSYCTTACLILPNQVSNACTYLVMLRGSKKLINYTWIRI